MKRIVAFSIVLFCMTVALAQQWPRTVMRGDFEDPTMVRDGKDFYMTHSSFYDFPAFLIWHSTDLMNWTPLCRVVEDAWSGVAVRPLLQKEADGRFSLCFEAGDSLYRYEADKAKGPWRRVSVSDAKGRKDFHDVFGGHKVVRVNDTKGQDYVVYDEALKGYGSFGRQTMVEPVKKENGGAWKSMSDEMNRKNRKRNGGRFWRESDTKKMPEMRIRMNDNFAGQRVGLQWSMWKEFSMNSARIERGTLHLTACGASPADGRKLMTKAIDKNYLVQTQVLSSSGNWSGLILFADEGHFCGVVTDGKHFVIYEDGKEKERKENTYGKSCYLRMVNHRQRVRIQVSDTGRRWETLAQGMNVESYVNVHADGMALRPALVAYGHGDGCFRKFRYAVK